MFAKSATKTSVLTRLLREEVLDELSFLLIARDLVLFIDEVQNGILEKCFQLDEGRS